MMPHIFLERIFDEPFTPDDVLEGGRESAMVLRPAPGQVARQLLALDGRTMICSFAAPDAESVRLALRDPDTDLCGSGPAPCTAGRSGVTPNVLVERSFAAPVRSRTSRHSERQSLVPRDLQREVMRTRSSRSIASECCVYTRRPTPRPCAASTRGRRSGLRHLGRLIGRTRASASASFPRSPAQIPRSLPRSVPRPGLIVSAVPGRRPDPLLKTRGNEMNIPNQSRQRRQRRSTARRARGAHRSTGSRAVQVARHLRLGQRHAQPLDGQGFYGLGAEQSRNKTFRFDADHPEVFASEDKGATPVEYVLVGARGVPDGRHRGRRPEPQHPVALRQSDAQGRHGHARHPRHRQRCAQRLRWHQGDVRDRRRCDARGDRGAGRAIADALCRVRYRHEPDQRRGRGGDDGRRAAHRQSGRHRRRRRHRRRPRRPRDEPRARRARRRSRRARARRGRELVAARALGFAALAHAELANPAAGLPLRRAAIPTAT